MKPPVFHRMLDYDRRLLPNAHLASLEEGVNDLDTAQLRTGSTIGYPGWGVIYHVLLAHLDRSRPQTLIETGSNWGCSTIVLAQALIDAGCEGQVLSFEIDADNARIASDNLTAAGVSDRVKIHLGDSRRLLPRALATVDEVRFAYLDASHKHADVLREFSVLQPKLTDDALVVFDNTYRIASEGEDQRVNGALREIRDIHGGNLVNLEFVSWYTPGLAIWQKTPRL